MTYIFNKDNISIRRGNYQDVEEILDICKASFPNSLKWKGERKIVNEWWKQLSKLPFVEIYMAESKGQIVAFIVLIIDINEYNKAIKNIKMPIFDKIKILLNQPNIIFTQLYKKISLYFSFHKNTPYQNIYGKVNETVWVELGAVSPNFRRMGIHTLLHNHIKNRAMDLGKRIIGMEVEPNSKSSINFHYSIGYLLSGKSKTGFIFKKRI